MKFEHDTVRVTNQIKDFLAFAERTNRRFVLVVREGALLSRYLEMLVNDKRIKLVKLAAE